MPIHDWTRVSAGTFHAFHTAWISELQRALNAGVLPDGFYALAEQVASDIVPDVLTLQEAAGAVGADQESVGGSSGVAVATAPPRVSMREVADENSILELRQRHLVIRHTTGDRIVALIEIVSPGNKSKRKAIDSFVEKAIRALDQGYHLLILDLFPPGTFDPTGMHGTIWLEFGGTYAPPAGRPLTLAAYAVSDPINCYVEPTAVGTDLIDMPLFINAGHYVNVALELTYRRAYEGVPQRWTRVIEGT